MFHGTISLFCLSSSKRLESSFYYVKFSFWWNCLYTLFDFVFDIFSILHDRLDLRLDQESLSFWSGSDWLKE